MNAGNDLRAGQQQQIVVALQIVALRYVCVVATGAVHVRTVVALGKAGAAVIGLLQIVALDHGAHRAIDDEDALGKRGGELGCAFGT